jgi:hypothetical protein
MRVASLLFLTASAIAETPLTLHTAQGTTCLDGSVAGYYYGSASPSSTKWVVFFEGGGACYSQADCAARSKTSLGSSKSWSPTFLQDDNLLSSDPAVNPEYFNAHHVYIPYCTGDAHSGTRPGALNSTWPFFFSGHLNVGVIVHALITAHETASLSAADTLLVSGSSAGGIGAFLNVDYIASLLPATVSVRAAPQGGWFYPPVTLFAYWAAGKDVPVWQVFGFAVSTLWAAYTLPACVQAHNETFCGSVNNYAPFISSPVFVGENLVDSQQVFNELLAPPTSTLLPAFKSYYRKQMNASLYEKVASREGWGVWAPGCFDHTADIKLGGQNGTTIDGISYRDALSQWINGNKTIFIIDSCTGQVPCNPTCRP